MREAVFVSYARTGMAKAARGGFNMTPAMSMAAHAIQAAVAKSGVEPEAVEDVALGNGAHGAGNLGRLSGLLAGLPVTTGGNTIQRHCSSGLNSIAVGANYIKADAADVVVAELDPAVTRMAREGLFLANAAVDVVHADARTVLAAAAPGSNALPR